MTSTGWRVVLLNVQTNTRTVATLTPEQLLSTEWHVAVFLNYRTFTPHMPLNCKLYQPSVAALIPSAESTLVLAEYNKHKIV